MPLRSQIHSTFSFFFLISIASFHISTTTASLPQSYYPSAFIGNLLSKTNSKSSSSPPTPKSPGIQRIKLEDELINTIQNNPKRLDNSQEIDYLISRLELSGYSIPQPAIAPQVIGKWKLIYTNNADTASPIQRKAVDASLFNIYQDIILKDNKQLVISQIVKFGFGSELCVDALASTSKYPLEELTDRIGTGKILGLNVLGVSKVGEEAKEDPNKPDSRIKFVFDEGNFNLFDSMTVPYPVPFRLPILRDTVKGWIDITYLSDRLRISKGNKGTTFVLVKEEDSE
jgi:hypothetical protein